MALGRALGLGLVAEGVETEEQQVLLRFAGCEEMQGFLFARPGPREAINWPPGGGQRASRRIAANTARQSCRGVTDRR